MSVLIGYLWLYNHNFMLCNPTFIVASSAGKYVKYFPCICVLNTVIENIYYLYLKYFLLIFCILF